MQNGDDSYFTAPHAQSPGSDVEDEDDDALPLYLQQMEDRDGLIMGRTPDMVRYLLMKAKHNYALGQHEALIEELRVVRYELAREREVKDQVLDRVLRASFGCVSSRMPPVSGR